MGVEDLQLEKLEQALAALEARGLAPRIAHNIAGRQPEDVDSLLDLLQKQKDGILQTGKDAQIICKGPYIILMAER